MSIIRDGQHVAFINTKTNEFKCVKVPRKQPLFLKPFSFQTDSLVGQQFGLHYQVLKQKLIEVVDPVKVTEPLENCSKTNEFIKDDGSTQILSQHDIENMKANGVKGEEIVKNLVENSTSYNDKTEFSKAKWLKKKINKHQPNITTRRPSVRLFCSSNTSKLRPDILAKIVNNANIWMGAKVFVAECKDDLLTSAIAQRVHRDGSVVQIFEQKLPHIMYCRWLDFEAPQLDVLKYFPLKFLFKLNENSNTEAVSLEQAEEPQSMNDEEIALGKRKREEAEEEFVKYTSLFNEMKRNDFDSLVISANYDPFPVLEHLWGRLRYSGTVVIHTEYLSSVIACCNFVNKMGCSEMSVIDQWFREIQVLPGRTHPDMRMQTGGGFIMTCTKLAEGIYEHGSDTPVPSDNGEVVEGKTE